MEKNDNIKILIDDMINVKILVQKYKKDNYKNLILKLEILINFYIDSFNKIREKFGFDCVIIEDIYQSYEINEKSLILEDFEILENDNKNNNTKIDKDISDIENKIDNDINNIINENTLNSSFISNEETSGYIDKLDLINKEEINIKIFSIFTDYIKNNLIKEFFNFVTQNITLKRIIIKILVLIRKLEILSKYLISALTFDKDDLISFDINSQTWKDLINNNKITFVVY